MAMSWRSLRKGVRGNNASVETGSQDIAASLVLSAEVSAMASVLGIYPIAVFRCLKRRCAVRDSCKEIAVFRKGFRLNARGSSSPMKVLEQVAGILGSWSVR